MGRRYRKSHILDVANLVPKEADPAIIDPQFDAIADTEQRNQEIIEAAGTGGFDSVQICERLINCNIKGGKPCRSPACHECSRASRRIHAFDGLVCLDLPPKLEKEADNIVFVTLVDHSWIRKEGDLGSFSMRREGKRFVEKLMGAELGIQVFYGAWCFLFRAWTPNSDERKTLRFWQPHVHAIARISGDKATFSKKLRRQFERKSIVGVDRPTVVKGVKNPLYQLTYIRKQMFGSSVGSEATAGARMRFPAPLEPCQLEEVSVMLDRQGYKPRSILLGCKYIDGRIVKDE